VSDFIRGDNAGGGYPWKTGMKKTSLTGEPDHHDHFRNVLVTALAITGILLVISPASANTAGNTVIGSNTSYPSIKIGYTSASGQTDNANQIFADQYTTTVPLTAISISSYGTENGNVKVAIYTNSPSLNRPETLLFPEVAHRTSKNTWTTIPIPNTYLPAGTYWIVFKTDQNRAVVKTNSASGYTQYSSPAPYKNALPNPGTGVGWSPHPSVRDSIYITGVPIEGYQKATRVILSDNSAVVQNVSFYSHVTGNFMLAIYSDSAGPYNLLWTSSSTPAATAPGWNTVPISAGTPASLMLQSGTYWLAWQWDSAGSGPSYRAGSSGTGNYRFSDGPFPPVWDDGTSSNENWSEYITYSAGIPLISIGPVNGSPQVDQTLTAGSLTPSGATASYQWQRSATPGGTCTAIPGATRANYIPVTGDTGYYLGVVATGTGSYTGTVTSACVGPVRAPVSVSITMSTLTSGVGNNPTINLSATPQTPGTDSSLIANVSVSQANWSVTVADTSTYSSSHAGYMSEYIQGPPGSYVSSGRVYTNPLQLSGVSVAGKATATAGDNKDIGPVPSSGGAQLYTGLASVTNLLLSNNLTQRVEYSDQVLPSGETYRVDLTYTITAY